MPEPSEQPLVARKIGHVLTISADLAMDYGLIPDTRPPRPPIPRRALLRWWWRDHLSVRALRSRLAAWIDPEEPHECDC